MNWEISLPEVFNRYACLHFLNRSEQECLFKIHDEKILFIFNTPVQNIYLEISFPDNNKLLIESSQVKCSLEEKNLITNHIIDWLDLKTSLSSFYDVAEKDKILAPLVKKYSGLRLIGIPSLFEAMAWSIIGQQINLTFAYTLKRKLVEKYGLKKKVNKNYFYCFPEPLTIIDLTIEDLKSIQFSRQKADYLIGIAKLMNSGELNKEMLNQLSFEDAREKLKKIRGVGNWTANYVLMKCIRHPQAFPKEDVGLHNAIKKQLGLAQKPDIATIEKMAEPWGGWKAYATFYLWHSLLD